LEITKTTPSKLAIKLVLRKKLNQKSERPVPCKAKVLIKEIGDNTN
jgi:hypothetical protein